MRAGLNLGSDTDGDPSATARMGVAMASLGASMYDVDIDVPCPRCSYPVWVRGVEVAAQTTVLCPVCRTHLRLVDEEASMSGVAREIDSAVEDLIKTIGRTFG